MTRELPHRMTPMGTTLTLKQRGTLCEIRRLLLTAILNADSGAIDDDALSLRTAFNAWAMAACSRNGL
jgi:hypothetical protein